MATRQRVLHVLPAVLALCLAISGGAAAGEGAATGGGAATPHPHPGHRGEALGPGKGRVDQRGPRAGAAGLVATGGGASPPHPHHGHPPPDRDGGPGARPALIASPFAFARPECLSAHDPDGAWFARFGVPRTLEEVLTNASEPVRHSYHIDVFKRTVGGEDRRLAYVQNPKAASTAIRSILGLERTHHTWSPKLGPAFCSVRDPLRRLISGYGTVQGRLFDPRQGLSEVVPPGEFKAVLRSSADAFFERIEALGPPATYESFARNNSRARSSYMPHHHYRGLHHLPFFRVRREPQRFAQFVRDIRNYKIFNYHLGSQTFYATVSTKTGGPVPVPFFVRAEKLEEGMQALRDTEPFRSVLAGVELNRISSTARSGHGGSNVDELHTILSGSALGRELLRGTFRYQGRERYLREETIPPATISEIRELYRQDYACFGY